jgi:hypothetical protein
MRFGPSAPHLQRVAHQQSKQGKKNYLLRELQVLLNVRGFENRTYRKSTLPGAEMVPV